MNIERLSVKTDAVVPLMAALPYRVTLDRPSDGPALYDPETQLSYFGGRNFSTCREDESVGGVLSPSKADTKKDD